MRVRVGPRYSRKMEGDDEELCSGTSFMVGKISSCGRS